MSKKVTNTTTDPRPEWLFGGNPRAIEAQEAAGQRELAESTQLPTKIPPDQKAKLESMGVKFLGPTEGDRLFQNVELPKGWQKKPTGHSMWTDLVDDKGNKVAAIFYKAAFYDRDAFMHLTPPKEDVQERGTQAVD